MALERDFRGETSGGPDLARSSSFGADSESGPPQADLHGLGVGCLPSRNPPLVSRGLFAASPQAPGGSAAGDSRADEPS